jgi:hypothetical protein
VVDGGSLPPSRARTASGDSDSVDSWDYMSDSSVDSIAQKKVTSS